ncbi:HAD family hydrolase [Aspergillus stella-maris]|uniref:HAD family hydrolase n=1 Tax=Aspergillus stella-maris TaxID=1810926 RepID=UPI003CCDC7C8
MSPSPTAPSAAHSRLQSIQWAAFDLDDTIHEFRLASRAASQAIFEVIHREHNIPIEDLQGDYSAILATHTTNAFSDGRTSTEYRRDRFEALFRGRGIVASEESLTSLLLIYKDALSEALRPKPNALTTLQSLKEQGKTIIIITEGPRDAQEWTLEQLGVLPYVDILATSNDVGKTKVDGLVGQVIRGAGLSPREGVYIGDNLERDILPAIAEGIDAAHYNEGLEGELEGGFSTDGYISVNSWDVLARLLGSPR